MMVQGRGLDWQCPVWECTLLAPGLGRSKQVDIYEFEASLLYIASQSYLVRSDLKNKQISKNNNNNKKKTKPHKEESLLLFQRYIAPLQ